MRGGVPFAVTCLTAVADMAFSLPARDMVTGRCSNRWRRRREYSHADTVLCNFPSALGCRSVVLSSGAFQDTPIDWQSKQTKQFPHQILTIPGHAADPGPAQSSQHQPAAV